MNQPKTQHFEEDTPCPNCKESDSVIFNAQLAHTVCTSCGFVLQESIVRPEVAISTFNIGGTESVSFGAHIAADSAGGGLFSQSALSQVKVPGILSSERRSDAHDSPAKIAAIYKIRRLAGQLHLPQTYLGQIKRIFMAITKGKVRFGRVTEIIIAACVYIVARSNQKPITLLDVADSIQCNTFQLGSYYTQITKTLDIQLPNMDPAIYLKTICAKLDFDPSISNVISQRALRILNIAKRDWLVTGRMPSAITAAAILLASRASGESTEIRDLMRILHLGAAVIAKRQRELVESLVQLGSFLPWGQEINRDNITQHLDAILRDHDWLRDKKAGVERKAYLENQNPKNSDELLEINKKHLQPEFSPDSDVIPMDSRSRSATLLSLAINPIKNIRPIFYKVFDNKEKNEIRHSIAEEITQRQLSRQSLFNTIDITTTAAQTNIIPQQLPQLISTSAHTLNPRPSGLSVKTPTNIADPSISPLDASKAANPPPKFRQNKDKENDRILRILRARERVGLVQRLKEKHSVYEDSGLIITQDTTGSINDEFSLTDIKEKQRTKIARRRIRNKAGIKPWHLKRSLKPMVPINDIIIRVPLTAALDLGLSYILGRGGYALDRTTMNELSKLQQKQTLLKIAKRKKKIEDSQRIRGLASIRKQRARDEAQNRIIEQRKRRLASGNIKGGDSRYDSPSTEEPVDSDGQPFEDIDEEEDNEVSDTEALDLLHGGTETPFDDSYFTPSSAALALLNINFVPDFHSGNPDDTSVHFSEPIIFDLLSGQILDREDDLIETLLINNVSESDILTGWYDAIIAHLSDSVWRKKLMDIITNSSDPTEVGEGDIPEEEIDQYVRPDPYENLDSEESKKLRILHELKKRFWKRIAK